MSEEETGGPLSAEELDAFLAHPLLLKLACLRPDGWPYVVPLWYAWHGGRLYVVGRERAVWVQYLRAEPRVGVLVDEEAARHRRVQMTALARVVEGPVPLAGRSDRWRAIGAVLQQKYMGSERGQAYAQLTASRPRVLVEIEPVQTTTWRGGPWHPRYYAPEPGPPPPTARLAR